MNTNTKVNNPINKQNFENCASLLRIDWLKAGHSRSDFLSDLSSKPPKLDSISDREWAYWIVGNLVVRLGASRGTTQGQTSDW